MHTDPVNASPEVQVLVVDDQRPFRLAMRAVLRHLPGFTLAAEAETGEESVAIVPDVQPELVLMDINLPGMSGIEATRRILELAPGTIVFLCSTYDQDDLPPAVSASGAAAYINKEELTAARLRDLWTQHGPGATASGA